MPSSNPSKDLKYLATDLDGTLIPITPKEATRPGQAVGGLDQATAQHQFRASQDALAVLRSEVERGREPGFRMVFVTGRHFESVCEAIIEFQLPFPDWILCDVGSRCLQWTKNRESRPDSASAVADLFQESASYDDRLAELAGDYDGDALMRELTQVAPVRLQESFKQGRHKHSFYCDGEGLVDCERAIKAHLRGQGLRLNVVASLDPFTGDGLIDLMPPGVNKWFALQWWLQVSGVCPDHIVFAGDSGNDHAAMVSGLRTIVVGNASRQLARTVADHHREQQWKRRLFLAERPNTVAVLDGCRWFGLVGEDDTAVDCPGQLNEGELSGIVGATMIGANRTRFVVYGPEHESIFVRIDAVDPGPSSRRVSMHRTAAGYHVAVADQCGEGMLYRFDLGEDRLLADPSSRFQPDGVHGPSAVVDPAFAWTDANWKGIERRHLVLQEIHIGTFTDQGTYLAAIDRLDELVDLGVTGIEVMPVNQCGGNWNWGYDGVNWFAPMNAYGTPDELRLFVDAAHAKGLAVFLDVVYNHFGPEGNYLHDFGSYVSTKHKTVWGDVPNLDDGESAVQIRRWMTANVLMWLREYHIDGVRVDAIHCIADNSQKHWVREMSEAVAAWRRQSGRPACLIAESNVYDPEMLASLNDEELGERAMGFDAQWCDDFLHSVFAVVRPGQQLSNRTYESKQDLQSVLESGFVFEGTIRRDRERRRPPQRIDTRGLIYTIQNHDFIGNHPLGQRFHQVASMSAQRAAAALLILSPAIPMIFMGEEFACDRPFSFFVNFGDPGLRESVVAGRKAEYPQHDWSHGVLPTDAKAFHDSRIGKREDGSTHMLNWYRRLISLRKSWVDKGWLSDVTIKVACDTQRDVYGLSYRSDRRNGQDGPTHVGVVTRLTSTDDVSEHDDGHVSELLSQLGLPTETQHCALDSHAAPFRDSEDPPINRAWVFDR